jgi:hypothetical protein
MQPRQTHLGRLHDGAPLLARQLRIVLPQDAEHAVYVSHDRHLAIDLPLKRLNSLLIHIRQCDQLAAGHCKMTTA